MKPRLAAFCSLISLLANLFVFRSAHRRVSHPLFSSPGVALRRCKVGDGRTVASWWRRRGGHTPRAPCRAMPNGCGVWTDGMTALLPARRKAS